MTDTGGKKGRSARYRVASLYVVFENDDGIDAVAAALTRAGAQVWEIDEDVDLEHFPQGGVFHTSAVFRVRLKREQPLHELLSAAAHLPCVYSVCGMSR